MTARVPDHAALPVEQLRALLSIPPEWPVYLECGHCGDIAIYGDSHGMFSDGDGGRCLSCGHPGHVSADGDGDEDSFADWRVGDEPGDRCIEPGCRECDPRSVA